MALRELDTHRFLTEFLKWFIRESRKKKDSDMLDRIINLVLASSG